MKRTEYKKYWNKKYRRQSENVLTSGKRQKVQGKAIGKKKWLKMFIKNESYSRKLSE